MEVITGKKTKRNNIAAEVVVVWGGYFRYWLNKTPAEIEKIGLTDAVYVAKRTMQTNIQ